MFAQSAENKCVIGSCICVRIHMFLSHWTVVTSDTGGLDLGLSYEFGLGSYQLNIIPT